MSSLRRSAAVQREYIPTPNLLPHFPSDPKGKVQSVEDDKAEVKTKRGNTVSKNGDPENPAVVIKASSGVRTLTSFWFGRNACLLMSLPFCDFVRFAE